MNTLYLSMIVLMVHASSGQVEKSNSFFDNCFHSKLNLNNSVIVSDSLEYFSFQVPDSSWKAMRFLDSAGNGVTVGDTSKGYIRLFNVYQSEYTNPWNWEEEQKAVEMDFNVIETGDIYFHNQKGRYNIVLFENDEPQMISLYLTILDTINKRLYTLNLITENHPEFKDRFCEMKPIVESFKIKY
jgi:hypothetical protein